MRAIRYVVGYIREGGIGGPCANLVSAAHACCCTDSEGTAWDDSIATVGEVDKDTLDFRSATDQRVYLHSKGWDPGEHKHGGWPILYWCMWLLTFQVAAPGAWG